MAQASGGNASIKLGAGMMAVKASGARLAQAGRPESWALVRVAALLHAAGRLPSGAAGERAYAELLRRSSLTRGRRPSMESGVHAAIKHRFVVHLHSTAGIALSLLGRRRALALSRRASEGEWTTIFMPRTAPGRDLALAVGSTEPQGAVALRILEGHGLFWSSDDLASLERGIGRFEGRLRPVFGVDRMVPLHERGTRGCRGRAAAPTPRQRELCACRWPRFSFRLEPLFPDFAVFFPKPPERASACSAVVTASSPRERRDKTEVLFSHLAVSAALCRVAARARALPVRLAERVRSLETERARLSQMGALA